MVAHCGPKSGSRREAIETLTNAIKELQAIYLVKLQDTIYAGKLQAALNYMIMHDGW